MPDGNRVCAAIHVETGGASLLLDCGPGATHHMARFDVPWSRLTHLCLTHFHTDHVGGIPALLFALRYALPRPREAPLQIVGPQGTIALLERLAAALGDYLREPGFPLTVREIRPGGEIALDDGVRLTAAKTPHTEESIAYRLEAGGRLLGYTGDTGPSDDVADFLSGVHLLVSECSLPDALAIDTHLSPSSAAALALRARPDRLVLTHIYPQLDRGTLPGLLRAAGWDGVTEVADDGRDFTV